MIEHVNRICGRLSKALGLSVSLPDPDEKALRAASFRSLALGTALAAAGVLLRSRGLLLLGGAGRVGGTVPRKESRRRRGKE